MDTKFIAIGIGIGILLFTRYCPKEKIVGFLKPMFFSAGKFVSSFLTLRIGEKSAERFEQSVLITLCMAISESVGGFVDGLIEDNKNFKGKK